MKPIPWPIPLFIKGQPLSSRRWLCPRIFFHPLILFDDELSGHLSSPEMFWSRLKKLAFVNCRSVSSWPAWRVVMSTKQAEPLLFWIATNNRTDIFTWLALHGFRKLNASQNSKAKKDALRRGFEKGFQIAEWAEEIEENSAKKQTIQNDLFFTMEAYFDSFQGQELSKRHEIWTVHPFASQSMKKRVLDMASSKIEKFEISKDL